MRTRREIDLLKRIGMIERTLDESGPSKWLEHDRNSLLEELNEYRRSREILIQDLVSALRSAHTRIVSFKQEPGDRELLVYFGSLIKRASESKSE